MRQRAVLWLALTALVIGGEQANAGFIVCNHADRRIDTAFGYIDRERGWVAEGWWIIAAGQCKTVHGADLTNRYYYLFAKSADREKHWTGDIPFCIEEKKFTLFQSQYGNNTAEDCARGGAEFAKFLKVDVHRQKNHTHTLTLRSETPPSSVADPPSQPYQPQPHQQVPPPGPSQQQPSPPAAPGGGTACQRYPNLC